MHSVELERKLKLPDPSKAMEGVWKLLRRTRQQMNTTQGKVVAVSGSPGERLSVQKRARIEAERAKGRGVSYAVHNSIR